MTLRHTLHLALLTGGLMAAGLCSTAGSLHADAVTVVEKESVWKYLAGPDDQGTAWRDSSFDDSTWPAGPGILGYGESYITTVVPFGGNPFNRWRTTYFRINFTLEHAAAEIQRLKLKANYDDGFVAYLNGVEIQRGSMFTGPITYSTLAINHEGGVYETFDVSSFAGQLVDGVNVLAVEMHQASSGSDDLVHDMELTYSTDPAFIERGPYLQKAGPNSLTVRWRTDLPTTSQVFYSTFPDYPIFFERDFTSTTEHEVTISGLSPDQRYYYWIGSTGEVFVGDLSYTFVTAPPHGTAQTTKVWLIGDSGQANQNARDVRNGYAAYTDSADTDVWIMLGDNAYVTGTDVQYQAAVFDMYPLMLRQTPLWPTRGNHDNLHAGINNDYYEIFSLPDSGQAGGLISGSEAYYSFDYSNIHFVCLDSEGSSRAVGSPMLQWLRADLAATAQDWIIAFWHHPPYTKGSHDSDNVNDSGGRMRDMRENVLPILDSTGVDLVFAGHSHSYERSFLLSGHYGLSSTLTPAMEIDDGDGRETGDGAYVKPTVGQGPFEGAVYTVAGSSSQISGGGLNHPVMVESQNVLGSVLLEITGPRLDATFIDGGGAPRDSFTMFKGAIVDVAPGAAAATSLQLAAVTPNPSVSTVRIDFALPRGGEVDLRILDVTGRRVATLARNSLPAGRHSVAWNGLGDSGAPVAPGVYFAMLEQGGERRVARLVRMQ